MNYYFIQKEAVYYHGVCGIYTDEKEAFAACLDIATNDTDDHHSYDLYRFVAPSSTDIQHPDINSHQLISSWRKSQAQAFKESQALL